MSLRWNWRLKNYPAEWKSQEVLRVDVGVRSDWRKCEKERLVSLNSLFHKRVRLLGEDIGRILSFMAHRWQFISLENAVHIIIGMRVK